MLLRLMVVLLLLCPLRSSGDVTYVDGGDVLTTSENQTSFITASTYTLMGYLKSSGADLADGSCAGGAPLIGDSNYDNFGVHRSGTNGEGLCVWQYASGFTQKYTPTVAMPNGWHHFAARVSGTTLEIFLDGVSGGTNTLTGGAEPLSGYPLRLGSGLVGDRMTEIKTYNVAVSTEEILRQARNRLRVYERTPPTAHWTFEQCGEGSTAHGVVFRDLSGNGRTVTGNSGGSGLTCVGSEFVSRPWGIQ